MDITFEEVAHVIQDARYQQAIFDPDTPRPERKIPLPPRGFNQSNFMEEHNVCLRTVLAEPLGRFFLGFYVDGFTEYGNSKSNQSEQARCLRFARVLYRARRRDPSAIVSLVEVLRLLRDFGLLEAIKIPDTRQDGNGASPKDNSEALNALLASYTSQKQTDSPTQAEEIDLVMADIVSSVDDEISASDESRGRMSMSKPTDGSKKKGNTFGGETETAITRYDDEVASVSRSTNNGAKANRSFTGGAYSIPNTYGESAAAAVARANSHIVHSRQSLDINEAVQALMEEILSPVYERMTRDKKTFSQYIKLKWYSLQPVGDKQVRYHRVLGMGAFGTVHGCIVGSVGTMLAMKIMLRKKIKAKHAKSQVVAERQALEALAAHPSPYCMQLRYAYHTREAFHLVIPLAIGGDLKFHLHEGAFSEDRARIYAAEVAVGLGHIHSLGLIIRDLKPRNILLDSRGHCKISDLGLAASIADGTPVRGRAGTEGYWSPEVINNQHYSIDADWWSYGCCVFEFLAGFNPFSCKHTKLKTRNEGTRRGVVNFPQKFPHEAKSLVLGLLHKSVSNRLGCRGRGVDEVLNHAHPFWKNMDFNAVRRGDVRAPWVPEKGVIYALSQGEMQDNEEDQAGLRKIKLTQDDMPEFPPFVDIEDHQRDIVKVLETSGDYSRANMISRIQRANESYVSQQSRTGYGSEAPTKVFGQDEFSEGCRGCCTMS